MGWREVAKEASSKVTFMSAKLDFPYYKNDGMEILSLPYEHDGEVFCILFLTPLSQERGDLGGAHVSDPTNRGRP